MLNEQDDAERARRAALAESMRTAPKMQCRLMQWAGRVRESTALATVTGDAWDQQDAEYWRRAELAESTREAISIASRDAERNAR